MNDRFAREANTSTRLELIGRQVVGARKPWKSKLSANTPTIDESQAVSHRLARHRQLTALAGYAQRARKLLRSELFTSLGGTPPIGLMDAEKLLTADLRHAQPVLVAGIVRPMLGGQISIGDPGSSISFTAGGLRVQLPRGSPAIVRGRWDARQRSLFEARLEACQLLSSPDYDNSPQENRGTHALEVEDLDSTKAADYLEDSWSRNDLNLDSLLKLHEMLYRNGSTVRGKLRQGSAVVRLPGLPPFVPPPAHEAAHGTSVFLETLTSHISANWSGVPAPVVAADAAAYFTDLHPFEDGNGRVARAIAFWLLVRAGYCTKPNLSLTSFCSERRLECYYRLRRHYCDPWSWHEFFFDAVLSCFDQPASTLKHDV